MDSAKVCVFVCEVGSWGLMAGENAIPADFVLPSPSLSASLSASLSPYKPQTLFTLIIQIGFPGDEGMREENKVTGGP